LFKGWKLGLRKTAKETHRAYSERVLSRRVFGLKYSVAVCLDEFRIDKRIARAHSAAGDALFTHLILEQLKSTLRSDEDR
jgi:hypothetical protein